MHNFEDYDNYAEVSFKNKAVFDILANYVDVPIIEGIMSCSMEFNIKEKISDPIAPPENCEDVLNLFFCLLERSVLKIGEAYRSLKPGIMRDVMNNFSKILEAFEDVKAVIHTTDSYEPLTTTHTEFTFTRTTETTVRKTDDLS